MLIIVPCSDEPCTAWSQFGPCEAKCGVKGQRFQNRTCTYAHGREIITEQRYKPCVGPCPTAPTTTSTTTTITTTTPAPPAAGKPQIRYSGVNTSKNTVSLHDSQFASFRPVSTGIPEVQIKWRHLVLLPPWAHFHGVYLISRSGQ